MVLRPRPPPPTLLPSHSCSAHGPRATGSIRGPLGPQLPRDSEVGAAGVSVSYPNWHVADAPTLHRDPSHRPECSSLFMS